MMFSWSRLAPAPHADAWEERLAGFPGLVTEYLKGGRSVRLKVFLGTEREAVALAERFGGTIRKVKRADWERPVPEPRPVKVRERLLLTAATDPVKLRDLRRRHAGRELISIPAETAFGTGDHATTSTCLRLLCDVARQRKDQAWSVADLGAGTAVLAIAARKLGAGRVFACDFDPLAVAAARRNLVRNREPDIVLKQLDVLKWRVPKAGYDVVVANLFSTVLIEAWPVIARSLAPRADLIVSGILASQAWEVFEAAARAGLGFPQVIRKGKWVTARGGRMCDLIAAD
jgi:ribosomal protein L11 methyltransferase